MAEIVVIPERCGTFTNTATDNEFNTVSVDFTVVGCAEGGDVGPVVGGPVVAVVAGGAGGTGSQYQFQFQNQDQSATGPALGAAQTGYGANVRAQ